MTSFANITVTQYDWIDNDVYSDNSQLIIDTYTDSSSDLQEHFTGESERIVSGLVTGPTGGLDYWSSTGRFRKLRWW